MEAIPEVFGVEDSDELDESLQEDAQAVKDALGRHSHRSWP